MLYSFLRVSGYYGGVVDSEFCEGNSFFITSQMRFTFKFTNKPLDYSRVATYRYSVPGTYIPIRHGNTGLNNWAEISEIWDIRNLNHMNRNCHHLAAKRHLRALGY